MGFTQPQAKRLGTEAFVFGFPLLLMAATMRATTSIAAVGGRPTPLNRFAHLCRFPDPGFRAIVGANADTLYSLAWLDLSAEPLLLDVPDTGGRSYLMQLIDAWTDAFVCLGPRTAGTSGGTYALTGPGWRGTLPDGVQQVEASTNTVWVICHTHAAGREDLDCGRSVQQRLALRPLSAYGDSETPSQGVVDPELEPMPSPHVQLMELSARDFLDALADEMGRNPPTGADRPMLDRLAAIGLRPGQPFAWGNLPGEMREALEAGLTDGREAIASPPQQQLENGWRSLRNGLKANGADYLRRAQIANAALGITHPEDAMFPLTAIDEDGCRLTGEHRYVLRFEPEGLPPVGALWSLALYDMDQLVVDNPIDRYALGNRDELELGPDGSLEITIQYDRPENSGANWLPAPESDFNLMLHMYWPSRSALDGSWTVPPVRRVD